MNYEFVQLNAFVPNSSSGWTPFSNVVDYSAYGSKFRLTDSNGQTLWLEFLSATVLRVRFSAAAPFYAPDASYAVVNRSLAPVTPKVTTDTSALLVLDTGEMTVHIARQPYALSVYRGGQLIHADASVNGGNQGILYVEGQPALASIKVAPENALYFGFGEKGGSTLAKNGLSLTFFNYDNFMYGGTEVIPPPPAEYSGGPLNPSEPLYNSTPFLIETNPNPTGPYAGNPYSYGLLLDNPAQTYFNVSADVSVQRRAS